MYFKAKWWQLLFYETAIISLGIIIGTKWGYYFEDYLYFFLFLFAFCGGYALYFLINQIEEDK